MKQRYRTTLTTRSLLIGLLLLAALPLAGAEPSFTATAAFNAYAAGVEERLLQQHTSAKAFLVGSSPKTDLRLRQGEFRLEQLTPPNASPAGALIHDWRGTAFVPGASAADFECLLKNFNAYPKVYAPQVLRGHILAQQGDHFTASMRVRQKDVIAVVMDTSYDVTVGRLDPQHRYSLSRSIRISEIESPDTADEHALSPAEDHGFLWRLNTYWSYEERDGGLYIQIESITLTRAIPHGLAWAVQPFIQSIPRESLEFTLRSTTNALHR